jgi:hypothetical protein
MKYSIAAINPGTRRHRGVHAQPSPAAVPSHLPARRDRLRGALGVRGTQARAQRGGRGRQASRRHHSRRAGSAAAAAEPWHDQHDARSHCPHPQGRGQARPVADQPGTRPRAPLERDPAKRELPQGGRAAGAHRRRVRHRRAGLEGDARARRTDAADASRQQELEADRRTARSSRDHCHLARRALPPGRARERPAAQSSQR